MTVPAPTYLTVADVRAQSFIADLKDPSAIDDGDLTLLLQAAEDHIDGYVGRQRHPPYDTNVARVFPREQDYRRTNLADYPYEPEVPYEVSRACLRQVEWLYSQWWPSRATDDLPVQLDVSQQDVGGDGTISETYARGGLDLAAATLCPQARATLSGYRNRSASISTSSTRRYGIDPPSSREGSYLPRP